MTERRNKPSDGALTLILAALGAVLYVIAQIAVLWLNIR